MTKHQFERWLKLQLENLEIGLYRRAKREFSRAWSFVINTMYKNRADTLTPDNLSEVAAECAKAISNALKSVRR